MFLQLVMQLIKIGKTFWHNEDKVVSDFTKVWREMDKVESLTPVTQSQRKD